MDNVQDRVLEYEEWLPLTFKRIIHSVEGKKKELDKLMKSIANLIYKVSYLPPGRLHESWKSKLEQLRTVSEQNKKLEKKWRQACNLFSSCIFTQQTRTELEQILRNHEGHSPRVFVEATKKMELSNRYITVE